jgi:pimeloyl-ACP methyl ester carboxylesterase
MPYLSNNCFEKLHYRKSGNGPVLVLLHGFPDDGGLWRKIWPGLEDNFTVLVPDMPGSGESILPGDGLTIELMAEAVNDILEKEGISQAVIAGHSMGGYVAMAFLEKFPGKVKGIGMVHSTAAADDEEKKQTRNKVIALVEKGGKNAFMDQMIPGLFSPKTRAEHVEILAEQLQRGKLLPDRSVISFYKAMRDRSDRIELLKNNISPFLWVTGNDDTVIPVKKVLQQSSLSNVNFVKRYDNCGHMSMLEWPELLTRDLKTFISYCYQIKE